MVEMIFNKKTDWMSPLELRKFKELRESGALTYFREDVCLWCLGVVLKGKKYCSMGCKRQHEAFKKAEEEKRGRKV